MAKRDEEGGGGGWRTGGAHTLRLVLPHDHYHHHHRQYPPRGSYNNTTFGALRPLTLTLGPHPVPAVPPSPRAPPSLRDSTRKQSCPPVAYLFTPHAEYEGSTVIQEDLNKQTGVPRCHVHTTLALITRDSQLRLRLLKVITRQFNIFINELLVPQCNRMPTRTVQSRQ